MTLTRRRDTPSELALRSQLHARGYRYRIDSKPVPSLRSRADLVFARARVAVYVDGCFWHGCDEHGTWPKANAEWWRAKIEANMARDRNTEAQLAAVGWTVLRIWQHEPPEEALGRVMSAVGPPVAGIKRAKD